MIDFSTKLPGAKHGTEASSMCSRSLASNSQKVATASRGAFAQTLASMTADPNSSLVISASQLPVAGQNSAAAPSSSSGFISPMQGAGSVAPTLATSPAASPATASGTASADSMTTWYASSPADDAYWAQQPAAVQQLRNISSESEREQVASQLAQQGYSIDVPVMVWGWDAGITTQLRESAGYTWVPSGLQQNISEAPGVNVPGLTPYNPSSPPAGSILVG
jgi:hypothetical protein